MSDVPQFDSFILKTLPKMNLPKKMNAYFHGLPDNPYSVKATSVLVFDSHISVYHKDTIPLSFLLSPNITKKYCGMETKVYFTTNEEERKDDEYLGHCKVRIL